ncbi:RecQ family ATP-dependent DNA helicase [Oceanobacillus rekensis]|uniref:RecQ family ATP-dependent DNA helicase n=1 Tax=Oceanobacillus rekensis TaxID=937927 RepID=UPI001593BD4B|nr:RecQ family ATP-dependent DNA helicase [Oceanobacillus rekensis]
MQDTNLLEDTLKKQFGYTSFRTGQKEIIQDALGGEDVLGILPTGSGKSICYQLPARIQEGLTIVVSPLISLMIDQVKELKANNFKEVIAINSFMNPPERKSVYNSLYNYKLIYVSPELLQQQELIGRLKRLDVRLFVIDEAHCISQWGHEFRPDYLKLSEAIEALNHPTVMALSATATPQVQEDIIKALNRPNMNKRIYPMDRENITFCMEEVADDVEKIERMTRILGKYRIPALIYFTSRVAAENTARILSNRLEDRNIAFYHGGMEQIDRISIQQQFMNGQLDIVCCTSAFGMGINKSNIRLIIHFHLPLQLESYIQEVGRAGRDGKSSIGLLLYSPKDAFIPKNMIKNELPDKTDITNLFRHLYTMVQQGMEVATSNEQMENQLQINETQWKFFRFQLEKHGIIKNNRIQFQEENWRHALLSIETLIKERIQYKQEKLNDVLRWINEKECLRRNLYKFFQETYKNPKYHCCSNCGFTWDKWKPDETPLEKSHSESWQAKLKKVLLVGNVNEAE